MFRYTVTLSHLLRQPLRHILCRRPPQSEAGGATAAGVGGGRAAVSRDTTRVVGTSLATLTVQTIVIHPFHEKKTHSPLQEILNEIRMTRQASAACPFPSANPPPLPRNPPLARNTFLLARNPTPATPPPLDDCPYQAKPSPENIKARNTLSQNRWNPHNILSL
ncbi:hypothetical protein RHMOL_Rhmol12G0232900 [Rhododendron molle]|uniref:Uncharacterized protein n=1 Tax=Rhododendron molle TaxID=49168 RepID=A0ACC0LLG3_RHOML|nr:hypothetical protein RHMOL_Rhmol12G0232900 [Rhododendron molle]